MPLMQSFLSKTHLTSICVSTTSIICTQDTNMCLWVSNIIVQQQITFSLAVHNPRECQLSYFAAFVQMLWIPTVIPTAICSCCECLVSYIISVYWCIQPKIVTTSCLYLNWLLINGHLVIHLVIIEKFNFDPQNPEVRTQWPCSRSNFWHAINGLVIRHLRYKYQVSNSNGHWYMDICLFYWLQWENSALAHKIQ